MPINERHLHRIWNRDPLRAERRAKRARDVAQQRLETRHEPSRHVAALVAQEVANVVQNAPRDRGPYDPAAEAVYRRDVARGLALDPTRDGQAELPRKAAGPPVDYETAARRLDRVVDRIVTFKDRQKRQP